MGESDEDKRCSILNKNRLFDKYLCLPLYLMSDLMFQILCLTLRCVLDFSGQISAGRQEQMQQQAGNGHLNETRRTFQKSSGSHMLEFTTTSQVQGAV